MEALGATVTAIVTTSLAGIGDYFPQFLGGLILLLLGLTISALLKEVVLRFLRFLNLEAWMEDVSEWFEKMKSDKAARGSVWTGLVAELVRWTVVILFLVPAAEAWGLPKVTELLNQFLLYIPNVFVAAVVGFVGLVLANLVSEIIKHAGKGLGSASSNLLSTISRYALYFFTTLVVLNQLGVASDFVRILFTGIVAMPAIAGGLAFGLGGQGTAKKTLDDLQRKLSK